jgi:hypothetical protein
MEDLYSKQDLLREEQRKLLAILQDFSQPMPSNKITSKSPSTIIRRSKKSVDFDVKAFAASKASGDSGNVTGPEEEDKCEIEPRLYRKKESGDFYSLYHRSCTPEEPDRQFTATPIPRGILGRQGTNKSRGSDIFFPIAVRRENNLFLFFVLLLNKDRRPQEDLQEEVDQYHLPRLLQKESSREITITIIIMTMHSGQLAILKIPDQLF